MRVLIDTNVLLDSLMGRQPYFDMADRIICMCANKIIIGAMAAHSVPNMFYILRKNMNIEQRREVLRYLCQIIEVEGIDSGKILSAIDNTNFTDLEDCIQEECAVAIAADYIITRNTKDFTNSRIPALTPDEFLKLV